MDYQDRYCGCNYYCNPQTHVHEVSGSVFLAGPYGKTHDHHFASVSDEVIQVHGGHIHHIQAKTDFYDDHYHKINVKTGLGIPVGTGRDARHVHYVDSATQFEDGHVHKLLCATLVENPNSSKK